MNLLFSPRKTSLCFLRPEPRPPPPLAIPMRTAAASTKQVNSGSFMVHMRLTAASHHCYRCPGKVLPSGATPGPGVAPSVCSRSSSASWPDLHPPSAASLSLHACRCHHSSPTTTASSLFPSASSAAAHLSISD